jgi:cyclohexadienyl dehydratase
MMTKSTSFTVVAALAAFSLQAVAPAVAQQTQSRLFDVPKNHVLRVCTFPGYYAISYRDPATGKLTGIDIDLSQELGKELGAEVQYVETSFGTFIADLQANKCEIGMFGVGITLKRAQAVEFTTPYLQTGIYAVVRKGETIAKWEDIDKPGHTVAVTLGSYIEPFMKSYLKQAKVVSVAPPATREQELMARRVDAEIVDYPTAQKVTADFDWATTIEPPSRLISTPFAYAVMPGDQVWLNFLNLFVDTIKRDGRLAAAAERNHLGPIVAP